MAKHVTRIIVGALIVAFQATINRGSVVFCFTPECIGFNAVGLAIWLAGLYLIASGLRRAFARPPKPTNVIASTPE